MIIPQTTTTNRQIARAAGSVMVAFILGNLVGLARNILIARAFGTSPEMDAFTVANRVSETLFNLVAGGALASAFIPTFTGFLAKDERRNGWQLASAVANLILILLIMVSALAAIFAPQIVRYILAPSFAADPAKFNLTVNLMRLMLPSAVIFGLSGLVMAILNSHQVFFIPALTPSLYSLGMIFGVSILAPHWGIYGLAWGVVLGAFLHLALQIPSLIRLNGEYFLTLGLRFPAVREVARLMGPRLIGVAVVQLNFWVNVWLASRMVEGSVTGIWFGFNLMLMPQAAIAQSIAIASMPSFSRQVALGKLDEMRDSLAASLRGALLLSVPASLGLILLRKPLVALLYQRGEFTDRSTELVAWALLWYAGGLVAHSVVEIVSRSFYALRDTKTPVQVGAAAMSLNIVLSLLLSSLFARLGWMPHGGLALANTIATSLEMGGLLVLMRRRLGGLHGQRLLLGLSQAATAALVLFIGVVSWIGLTNGQPDWLVVGGGVSIGAGLYALATFALGVREARQAVSEVARRVGASRKLTP